MRIISAMIATALWFALPGLVARAFSDPLPIRNAFYLTVDRNEQVTGRVEWYTDGSFRVLDVNCRVVAVGSNRTPYLQVMKSLGNWKAVAWGKHIAEKLCEIPSIKRGNLELEP